MAKPQISTKRIAISKSNAQLVGIVGVAAFVTVFCLVACKAAISQNRYQAKITDGKETANLQLKENLEAFDKLQKSYKRFDGRNPNVLNASSTGTGDNEGKNSKIVLDALPSSYDFPALASSLEKILTDRSFKVGSLSGTDDQLNQQANGTSASPDEVPMPFSFSVSNASYSSVNDLMNVLEKSVRPIQIDTLNLSGGQTNMSLSVTAHTYYQPGKTVDIKLQSVETKAADTKVKAIK